MPPGSPHPEDEPTAALRTEAPTAADPERPAAALPPGYEYLGELGRGGMGVVYQARHVKLDRVCAVKMILAGGHAGPRERQRFEAEARAVARLQHPGIVQVFEVGEHDGVPFMALEFCPGGSLDRRLRDEPPTARAAAALVRDLADATQAAHAAGVLHRDLKPANVLLAADGTVKVTDFGLARHLDEDGQTLTGAVVGTPSYMPPEQARGDKALGPAVDVYALGATLYAALTGRPPFRGATAAETIHQVLTRDAVPLRALNPAVPRDLETVVHKCLQKDPAKRYASAAALADDLGRFLDGRPVLARPVGAIERGWRWCRRNPAVASLTAAVALVLLAGVAVATYFALRAEEKAAQYRREVVVANHERRRAEGLLYAASLREAVEYWDRGRFAEAEEVFHACQADLRGWEHDYVHTLWYGCQRTVLARRASFGVGAFTPDGRTFATTGPGASVKVWDLATGRAGPLLEGHARPVNALAYSADGRRLVSAAGPPNKPGTSTPVGQAEVKVWDVAAGRAVLTLEAHGHLVSAVAFSPDGRRVVTASQDRTVRVWEVETGREAFALPPFQSASVAAAFSPDGTRLVTAGDGAVQVWNAADGKPVRTQALGRSYAARLAFSPDGKRLAGGRGDGVVHVWELASGREVFSARGHPHAVTALAFRRDGRRLVSGGDDAVAVWEPFRGEVVETFKGHRGTVTAVGFDAEGTHVLSAGHDGTLRAWDVAVGQKPCRVLKRDDYVNAVAFSPDGRLLVTGGDRRADGPPAVQVWDVATGRRVRSVAGPVGDVTGVAFGPDGRRVASAGRDKTVRIGDAADGRELLVLRGHAAEVLCVAFSPDGRHIASGDAAIFDAQAKGPSAGGEVKVWDAATGREVLSFRAHAEDVLSVAFSPDGARLVTGGADGRAKVWDAATGRPLLALAGHAEAVLAVAFGPDGGRVATASHDKTVKVWDAATGDVVHTLWKHSDQVAAVAFSPDGQRLVSGGYDGTVRVWDPLLGHLTLTLNGHAEAVKAVAFSPDGRRIASGGDDATARLWEATLPSPRTATPPTARVPSFHVFEAGGCGY